MNTLTGSFRPLFLLLSTVLITSGAVLALVYGWVAYHVIYAPQDVPVLGYVLGHLPSASEASSIKGTLAGQPFDIVMPQSMMIYGFALMMIFSFGVMLGISRCLSSIGIQLLKVLSQAPPVAEKVKNPEPESPPATPGSYQF